MLRSLAGIPRVFAKTWPALLAWYFAGNVVRSAVLALAVPIGPESPLAALVIVPLAVLARLISYVGMFLVVRRALPTYRAVSEGDVHFESIRDAATEFMRILLASIIPFFTLYTLIGLLAEDLSDYASSAFRYSLGSDQSVLDVGDGPVALIVVVVAFAGRLGLKYLGARLPRWLAIVEIYLEATWVFVALTGISALFGPVVSWVGDRQVVHWVSDAREFFRGLWEPVRLLIDGIDWLAPTVAQLILLPLAWLLIGSIVYIRSLVSIVEDTVAVPEKVGNRVKSALDRVPKLLRRHSFLVTDEWDDVGQPVFFSLRIMLRAGLTSILVFIAAYGFVWAASQWIRRGTYSAIGAHDPAWWFIADPVVALVLGAILEPVRIVLLACAFDYCLGRWRARVQAAPEVSPVRV